MEKLKTDPNVGSPAKQKESSPLSRDILLSLLYFDLFQHPLTTRELLQHSSISGLSEPALGAGLEELLQKNLIGSDKNFFFLPPGTGLVERRIQGTQKANEYLRKAKKISGFIASFPFVRGIFLSGSISKGYADKNSDIDYFIVTEPGRLWLSRTLLILFKKTFLLNSRKYFCLNYFIDKDHLEIPDKNLFTAIELAYLLPVYNESIHQAIVHHNEWRHQFLPNFVQNTRALIPEGKKPVKKILEKLLNRLAGDRLDDFCLFITEKFWKYKFRKNLRNLDVAIRCKKHVSKFHPQNFQEVILERYEKKISEYENFHQIVLRP